MIKNFRKELGLSQAEFAEKLGVSQGAISHYETGRRSLDKEMADRLIAFAPSVGRSLTYNDVFGDPPEASDAA